MNRKRIAFLLIILLIGVWGLRKNVQDVSDSKSKSTIESNISEDFESKYKYDNNKFMHGMYQYSICNFKKEVKPITEVLEKISKRKSIPPDLLPEIKALNDSAQFMTMNDKLLLPDDGLSPEELIIESSIKVFAKELNLKSAELEQGVISGTDPYFLNLFKNVEKLVEPACLMYAATNIEKTKSPKPTLPTPRTDVFGNGNAQMEKIGKQVAYDGLCKLSSSAETLGVALENSKISSAFKPALLQATKVSIYDLAYASLTFRGDLLYKPSTSESYLVTSIDKVKSGLEDKRYSYWATGSTSVVSSIEKLMIEMRSIGDFGCSEAVKLKRT